MVRQTQNQYTHAPGRVSACCRQAGPGQSGFCFEIEDGIEVIYGELKRKKAPLVTGIVERNGAKGKMRSVYLRDPDGNLIELASYR